MAREVCPVCEAANVEVVRVGKQRIIEEHEVKIGNRTFVCLGSNKNFNDYPRRNLR